MRTKMGMLLVAIGVFCLGCGGYLILQSIITKGNDAERVIDTDKEVDFREEYILEDSLRQQVYDYENYVCSILNRYHTLLEWQRGGFHQPRFEKIGWHPDLLVELNLGEKGTVFAIECEWKKVMLNDQLNWATDEKVAACKRFEELHGMDVFAALGVGGTPDAPEEVYIVPIKDATAKMDRVALKKYKRPDNQATLYYDVDSHTLY